MDQPPFTRIGLVGLGLIGGSIALATRARWPQADVLGVDHGSGLEKARRFPSFSAVSDDLRALNGCDLIVLAAPVTQNVALLEPLARAIDSPAVVTDAGSTKRDIVAAAQKLPAHLTFIGGHPLGGAAAGGIEHARADLFQQRPWLFTPGGQQRDSADVQKLCDLARGLGSTPALLDADTHDRWLAFLSHLPQMTASALMDVVGEAVGEDGLALAGRGLIDTTRLASSPAGIWKDIAASNADQLGPALDILIARLENLRRDLAGGNAMNETFANAIRWRERLPKNA